MTDKNTPAFPFVAEDESGMMINMGMTLRDYFAAKAMQAIMAGQYPITKQPDAASRIALAAYQMADAMMEARTDEPVEGLAAIKKGKRNVRKHEDIR